MKVVLNLGACARLGVVALAFASMGCATQDIASAHRGQLFARTGLFALYSGGSGLTGPVLKPGTHFLGLYNELREVNCSLTTVTEALDTLTKDGVHFGFEISVRYAADCSDEGVLRTLATIVPERSVVIQPQQLYATFIRPAIGEAAREFVSPFRANELNEKQAEVTSGIRKRFLDIMSTREKKIVLIHEVNIAELKFPQQMDTANLERAVQSVLRDKAIAERERVAAEVETMRVKKQLAEKESELAAIRIITVGEALRKYPEYVQYDMQLRLPEIYREAGSRGNLVIAAPNPLTLQPMPHVSVPAPPPTAPSR